MFRAPLRSCLPLFPLALSLGCSGGKVYNPPSNQEQTSPRDEELKWELTTAVTGLSRVAGLEPIEFEEADWDGTLDCEADDMTATLHEAATYGARAPIFGPGSTDAVYRKPQILALGPGTCSVEVSLSDSDARELRTGHFAQEGDGGLMAPAGLLMRLVAVSDDTLWLFANTVTGFWRVDLSAGTAEFDDSLERPVTGAVSDGAGGAWIVLSATQSETGNPADQQVATLVHLDDTGAADGPGGDLPFNVISTGYDVDTAGGRVTAFSSNDLTQDDDGVLWVLDSLSKGLAGFDPVESGATAVTLDVLNPTAITWQSGQLVIVSGFALDKTSGSVAQEPSFLLVDPAGPTTTLAAPIPAPDEGWDAENASAFAMAPAGSSSSVQLQRWFDLAPVGKGELLLADPTSGRFIQVD